MKYVLTNPFTVGDLSNRITINTLELASVSLNFEPVYSNAGTAILSVVLFDPVSGYKFNIVYNDATSLAFWTNLDSATNIVTKAIFNRLQTDGKIPAGTLQ